MSRRAIARSSRRVGGRWAPIYPQMFADLPLFASNPAFANFRAMGSEGFMDGYAGPPNARAGRVYDAAMLTRTLQRILVDHASVEHALG